MDTEIPIVAEVHHHTEESTHQIEELAHNERLNTALEPIAVRLEELSGKVDNILHTIVALIPEETKPIANATERVGTDVMDIPIEEVESDKKEEKEKPEEKKRKRRKL